MTAEKILQAITGNRGEYVIFGIRSDDRLFDVGEALPCSQNMIDDLYDPESGSYPLLDGTCATGFGNLWLDGDEEDLETIQKAITLNQKLYDLSSLYLIAGNDYSYGDDEAEIIIENAEVVMKI